MSSEPAPISAVPGGEPSEASTPQVETQEKPRYPWRLFFLLAAMMLVASLIIVPYVVQLSSVGNPKIASQVPAVAVSSLIQTVVLYFPMLLVGLLIAGRTGLGVPFLRAIAERRPVPPGFRRALFLSALLGFGMGGLLLVLSALLQKALPPQLTSIPVTQIPNAWQGFLASISAGITEEIILRLFLLTLIAWGIQYLAKRATSGRPNQVVLWAANVLAAVIFGLLHLPNLTALNVPVTLAMVAYIILLNGLAGLGFGWLYWSFGLEAAMLAHFFTDIILHVVTRL